MEVILAIDTMAKPFLTAIGNYEYAGNKQYSTQDFSIDEYDLASLVVQSVADANIVLESLNAIAVTVGPGALTSVRSGVSFANALAYSLHIPVIPVLSFELMGYQAAQNNPQPVLCTSRASQGNAYAGLYLEGAVKRMQFGPVMEVMQSLTVGLDSFITAGHHSFINSNGNSGIMRSQAGVFLDMEPELRQTACRFPDVAYPITEESEMFNGL